MLADAVGALSDPHALAFSALITTVLIDLDTQKSLPLTDELRAVFQAHLTP